MINLYELLQVIDINETILEINGVEYLPQQLTSSFFSEQVEYMKVYEIYVNPNNMMTVVIQF